MSVEVRLRPLAGWPYPQWACGFRTYLARKGQPADDLDEAWPLRPHRTVAP